MNQAMFLALCYGDIFDYPMTKKELVRWKINTKSIKTQANLGRQISKYKIINNYYCLEERTKIVQERKQKEKYSQKKLQIAKRAAGILQIIPFIKMIGITGALAMGNSGRDDDIDFLIITSAKRLWIVRFLAIILMELIGKRRRPGEKNIANKICLNMFLDNNSFLLAENLRNLYTAHEVCQVIPLFNQHHTYEKFILINNWVKKFLPNGIEKQTILIKENTRPTRGIDWKDLLKFFFEPILDLLNYAFFLIQYAYMKQRITREIVKKEYVFFHPRDTNKHVVGEFNRRIFLSK
jgi:hypothetical protein